VISEDGVVRTDSGICVALVGDLSDHVSVYMPGVWTSHGVDRFSLVEAGQVAGAIVELLNWEPNAN
jgi:hypothetical protein